MSYCRWSPVCDVYVYEDVYGGWTTRVAGQRRMVHPDGVSYPEYDFTNVETLRESLDAQKKWRDEAEYQGTGLPEVDNNYNHPTPGECAENLQYLKDLGYQVPQYAIDALQEEEDYEQK